MANRAPLVATLLLLVALGAHAASTPAHGGKGKGKGSSPAVCSSLPKCSNLCPALGSIDSGCGFVTADELMLWLNDYNTPIAVEIRADVSGGQCSLRTEPNPSAIATACTVDGNGDIIVAAGCPNGFAVMQNTCIGQTGDSRARAADWQVQVDNIAGCVYYSPPGTPATIEEYVMCVRVGSPAPQAPAGTKSANLGVSSVAAGDLMKLFKEKTTLP